jgi:Spy/CpxP family protein refolding chaperone
MIPRKALFVAFLSGLLIGGAAAWFAAPFLRFHHPRDPERMHQRLMKKFSRELNLSDEQARQVDQIFRASREKMKALHDDAFPKFEALRKETQTAIRALLTPDQQAKFDAMHEKWEKKKFRRRFDGPSPEDAPRP